MTKEQVSYEQLIETRYKLIEIILQSLTTNERKFLLSIKEGGPDCQLMPIEGLDKLPGLGWKKMNITKMDAEKHRSALEKLKKVLQL